MFPNPSNSGCLSLNSSLPPPHSFLSIFSSLIVSGPYTYTYLFLTRLNQSLPIALKMFLCEISSLFSTLSDLDQTLIYNVDFNLFHCVSPLFDLSDQQKLIMSLNLKTYDGPFTLASLF